MPLLIRTVFLSYMYHVYFFFCSSLRARAVKRLAGIVDADGSLMRREAVRLSVTSSFLDEAVSVRQVSVP